MPNELAVVTEGFPTLIACTGSLSSVASPMFSEARSPTSALTALTALIELLPCVDSLVLNEA